MPDSRSGTEDVQNEWEYFISESKDTIKDTCVLSEGIRSQGEAPPPHPNMEQFAL